MGQLLALRCCSPLPHLQQHYGIGTTYLDRKDEEMEVAQPLSKSVQLESRQVPDTILCDGEPVFLTSVLFYLSMLAITTL